MKRALSILILLCLFLCGCSQLYFEPEQTVLISAIGIDSAANGLLLTVEAVDTWAPDAGLEYSKKTFESFGSDCKSAFLSLQKSLGNKLTADHCATVVKGENISRALLYETLLYLSTAEALSQNTKIVSTENANEMLKLKSRTGQAVGYDAVKILNMQNDKDLFLGCNFYSVLGALEKEKPLNLPFFKTQNNSYFLDGVKNE